jgi:hypothetical protein
LSSQEWTGIIDHTKEKCDLTKDRSTSKQFETKQGQKSDRNIGKEFQTQEGQKSDRNIGKE